MDDVSCSLTTSDLSPRIGVLIAERLLVAGLHHQESANEAEAARLRLAFLFRASQHLAASLDSETLLRVLLELVVPDFADGCMVHLPETDRREHPTTIAVAETLNARSVDWWEWLDRLTRPLITRVLRTSKSQMGSSSRRQRQMQPPGGGHVSYVVAPLPARGRIVGTLCAFSLETRKNYGAEDLGLAEALGTQAGLALDNARLYAEQLEVIERLQHARSQLDAVQRDRLLEDERRRIARELHDHVEQAFFAIGLAASAASGNRGRGAEVASPDDALAHVTRLAGSGAEKLRAAIFALNYAEVRERGLIPELWRQTREFQTRTGVDTDLVVTGSARRLPTDVAETLHSVAREALANIERHAHASAVVLGLHIGPRAVTLTIQDDGTGASPLVLRQINRSTIHFGLRGIRQRVRELNGRSSARPGADGGFIVRARIPLQRESAT